MIQEVEYACVHNHFNCRLVGLPINIHRNKGTCADIMVKNVCVSELVWGIRLGIDGFRCAVHVDINRIDGDQHDRATLKTLTRLGTDMHSVIF